MAIESRGVSIAAVHVLAALWLGACGASRAGVAPDGPPDAPVDPDAGVTPPDGMPDGGMPDAAPAVPVALATGQHAPSGIAVDASHVYWTTSDGNVMKV